ncbi:hypothetical protein HNP93_001345 [Methanococcus maripaludis]|uniref:Uncharacterized protein n=1 Tax=Methanococcus maripaludis TaxID=39152 RepID=A0A7J9P772_METMI|nr:hypothetical protein [Methanococcus maripaludis]MBA2858644.1 hypothetical protein [Methanococcus maripaludis]
MQEMKDGDFLKSDNGVLFLILRKFRNGDFIALSDVDSKPERFSSIDVRNYEVIGNLENKPLNLLKQVIGVKV